MRKVNDVAEQHGAQRVTAIHVQLGPLSHMSPEHFREHFDRVAKGSLAEHAELRIDEIKDIADPHAQDILIKDVEVEVSE